MKWFIKVLRQYADFSGRARRKEYWMYTLFYLIFATALFIIGNILSGGRIFYFIYVLGMFLPSLAVAVRRLHDTGRSGWWLLLVSPYVCLVPLTIINNIHGRSSPDGGIAALIMLCSLLGFAGCIWLIVLLAKDGQEGDNQYGKDPKSDRIQILQTPSQDMGKVTVSSGSGNMFWKIIQLLMSIALIIAGASGQFVLRGTNSSELLIVFGCIWLAYDIYVIFNHKKVKEKLRATLDDSLAIEANRMESPCTISLKRPGNMIGAIIGVRIYLNGVQYGTLKNGKTVVMQTDYVQNVLAIYANASDSEMTCSLRFEAVPGGHVQITFKYVGMKLILEGVYGTQQPAKRIVSEDLQQPDQTPQPIAPVVSSEQTVPDDLQPIAPVISSEQTVPEDSQPVYDAPQSVTSQTSFLRDDDESQTSVSVKIPDSQEKISLPPKKKMYRISIACLITGIVMILGFVLLKQTHLLSNSGQKTMSGDLIIEHESASASGTFHDINIDDWSEEHLPGYIKQSRSSDMGRYFLGAVIIGCVLVVLGIVLLIGYKRRKANPKTTTQKQPESQKNVRDDKPRNSTSKSEQPKGYQVYIGMGVCDVCNRPLTGVKAYIVPNSMFYSSRKWRAYFKRISSVTDADIELMRKNDHSQSSAVCENCIHMF
jgi:uncharacterized membrane protein YhaH (DUF805 family)